MWLFFLFSRAFCRKIRMVLYLSVMSTTDRYILVLSGSMANILYLILMYTRHLSETVISTSAFKLPVKQDLKNYRLALTQEHNL